MTSTAKKSTKSTKSTKAEKADEQEHEFGAGFENFRERAIRLNGNASEVKISDEPFKLGKEDGFTFEMELPKPGFKTRMAIEAALESGSAIRVLQLAFGRYLDPMLNDLDAYERETGNSAADVLTGLVLNYLEHFYGEGAMSQAFPKLSI